MKFDTMRWQDGRFELLDQRRLPGKTEYLSLSSAIEVAGAIRDMAVRGAPAIGCAAAFGIALEAARCMNLAHPAFFSALDNGFSVLSKSRPTAVNLFWALDRMKDAIDPEDNPQAIAKELEITAISIFNEDVGANLEMGRFGQAIVPDKCSILTYCNAGALATAGHGTALGIIRSAHQAGKSVSVFSCETRPLLQGARLTAWELANEDIPVTLICDNTAGYLMSRGQIDMVIVGADRVAANGDVANKIGTYTMAVLAKRHGIPFVVACPISTIDMKTPDGEGIPIEERNADEVRGYDGCHWAAQGVSVRNPAFDVTPHELVTALVTEKGLIEFPDAEKLSAFLAS
jgi:methylthioribose-1-phosphate isomerase